jgi:hypothetical protein
MLDKYHVISYSKSVKNVFLNVLNYFTFVICPDTLLFIAVADRGSGLEDPGINQCSSAVPF